MSLLPTRDRFAEERFIATLSPHPQTETIMELVQEAMTTKRIQLAAKLISLIPEQDEETELFTKARKASQFMLMDKEEEIFFDDLCTEWLQYTARKKRIAVQQRNRPQSPFHRRRPR